MKLPERIQCYKDRQYAYELFHYSERRTQKYQENCLEKESNHYFLDRNKYRETVTDWKTTLFSVIFLTFYFIINPLSLYLISLALRSQNIT